MRHSDPVDRVGDEAAQGWHRRLWCGDCRSIETFEEIHQEGPGAADPLTEALLCTACGAGYFADFEVDLSRLAEADPPAEPMAS